MKNELTINKTITFIKTWRYYLACVILVVFPILLGIRFYVNHFTTGDEPHYLLMDYSLSKDHDFDLKNNYVNEDYFRYYPEYIYPHVSYLNIQDPNSGWYSFHGIGLPLLVYPAYNLSEVKGPAVMMVLIAATVIGLAFIWTFRVTKSRKASGITATCLLFCYFFNGLAGYLFPDLMIALLCLVSFIILSSKFVYKNNYQFFLSFVLGAMVFFHFRTLAFVFPVAVFNMYMYWKNNNHKLPWLFIIPSLFFAFIFFISLHAWFGVWEPNKIYNPNVGVSIKHLINTPAILFDSLRGSIVYNPILLLVPIGLPLWWKYHRTTAVLLFLLIPIMYVTFGFNEWHGGYAPNGRYLMGLLPLMFPAIALFILHVRSWYNRLFFAMLIGATVMISSIATLIKQPYTGYASRSEVFIYIEKYLGIGLDKFFPRYNFMTNVTTDRYGNIQAMFWTVVLIMLFMYGVMLAKKKYNNNQ